MRKREKEWEGRGITQKEKTEKLFEWGGKTGYTMHNGSCC